MMKASFTIRVVGPNPHRKGTISWRAGQVAIALKGCDVLSIVQALTALERDTTPKGIAAPARWLTHFAGLESVESGKHIEPWIEIVHQSKPVKSLRACRELLKG